MNEVFTPIRFHFYSLKFTPYNENRDVYTCTSILKDVVGYITNQKNNGKGHLINKNQNRKQEGPREIFMTDAVLMLKENRIRCSLALLRAGRVPLLKPVDKFKLIPLENIGSIAEETHFYIDFSKGQGVICLEFNNYGPRLSDIEFYLRNVARDVLKLAKSTEIEVYMDSSIDKTLSDFKNVLNMDIKIQPRKLAHMDTELVGKYFTGMNTIGNQLKPKFLKLEALFQTPGNTIKSSEINKEANGMFIDLIKKFKSRPFNIDCFENFVVRYEDKDGQEEIFNLLKGKREILKEVDLNKIKKKRDWYELIETDFDEFMSTL